jgi:hypothetical protein
MDREEYVGVANYQLWEEKRKGGIGRPAGKDLGKE